MKDLVELALSWLEAKRLADALCPKFDRTVIDSLVTFTGWNRRDGAVGGDGESGESDSSWTLGLEQVLAKVQRLG
jgi:hypothetical protein